MQAAVAKRLGALGLVKLGARPFYLKVFAWRVCLLRERHDRGLGRGGTGACAVGGHKFYLQNLCKAHLHIVSFKQGAAHALTGRRHRGPPRHAALVVRWAHVERVLVRRFFGGDPDRAMLADLAALRHAEKEVRDRRH
jgi:hypothetical protein